MCVTTGKARLASKGIWLADGGFEIPHKELHLHFMMEALPNTNLWPIYHGKIHSPDSMALAPQWQPRRPDTQLHAGSSSGSIPLGNTHHFTWTQENIVVGGESIGLASSGNHVTELKLLLYIY